jgi:glycerophosphoryl diester phosphodiesterase
MNKNKYIYFLLVLIMSYSRIYATGLPDISYEGNRVIVVSHRANFGTAPENSLSAIKACIEAGVDMIEIDVAQTKDGKLVLMHDKTINRTTDGTGQIIDMTWKDLQKLHLRQRNKGKTVTKEKVPTFEEVLTLCKDKIYVNLDLKGPSIFDCVQVIKKTKTENIIMYRATRLKWLKRVSLKFPQMIISPRFDFSRKDVKWPGKGTKLQFLEPYLKSIKIWGVDIPDLNHPAISKENLSSLKALNVRVWALTLWGKYNDQKALNNPAAVWGKLIDRGINVIMTDEPAALTKYAKSIGRR